MSNCTENGDLTHKGMTAQWQYNSEGTVSGKNGKRRPVPLLQPRLFPTVGNSIPNRMGMLFPGTGKTFPKRLGTTDVQPLFFKDL